MEETDETREGESEVEQATRWLEKITGDPGAGAVRGSIRIDRVSDAAARGRYQECRIAATAQAPGIAPTPVRDRKSVV